MFHVFREKNGTPERLVQVFSGGADLFSRPLHWFGFYDLPYRRQMMIIVLGNKIGEIDHPHRCF